MADKAGETAYQPSKPRPRGRKRHSRYIEPIQRARQLEGHKSKTDHPDQQPKHIAVNNRIKGRRDNASRHRADHQSFGRGPMPLSPIGFQSGRIDQHKKGQDDAQSGTQRNNQGQNRPGDKCGPRAESGLRDSTKNDCRDTYCKKLPAELDYAGCLELFCIQPSLAGPLVVDHIPLRDAAAQHTCANAAKRLGKAPKPFHQRTCFNGQT